MCARQLCFLRSRKLVGLTEINLWPKAYRSWLVVMRLIDERTGQVLAYVLTRILDGTGFTPASLLSTVFI